MKTQSNSVFLRDLRSTGRGWFIFAIVTHIITAATALRFANPDEWYQTVEFANFMQTGFMSKVFEVNAHLRNLSFPVILRLPLWLAEILAPGDAFSRIFAVKLFIGFLDLLVTFFFLKRMLDTIIPRPSVGTSGDEGFNSSDPNRWFHHLVYASFLLPWFSFSHAVRPSIEHMSSLVAMLLVALLVDPHARKSSSFGAGICLVFVGALRYPSFLFSLGVVAALLILQRRNFLLYVLPGMILGLSLFGLADWYYFGRPWESAWMYLQFNLFTGLSANYFGSQSVGVYFSFLWDQFGNGIMLWGMPLLLLGLWSIFKETRKGAVWAVGTTVYLVGHLFPTHKEGRFLIPILPFLTWAALSHLWQKRDIYMIKFAMHRRLFVSLGVLTLLVNSALSLEAWRGEWGKPRWDYLQILAVAKNERPCAVVTVTPLVSTFLAWDAPAKAPEVPTAFLDLDDQKDMTLEALQTTRIEWQDRTPVCERSAYAFIHMRQTHSLWTDLGCTEKSFYSSSIAQKLATLARASVLYRCPSEVLSKFNGSAAPWPLVRSLPHIANLPHYLVSPDTFMELVGGQDTLPPMGH